METAPAQVSLADEEKGQDQWCNSLTRYKLTIYATRQHRIDLQTFLEVNGMLDCHVCSSRFQTRELKDLQAAKRVDWGPHLGNPKYIVGAHSRSMMGIGSHIPAMFLLHSWDSRLRSTIIVHVDCTSHRMPLKLRAKDHALQNNEFSPALLAEDCIAALLHAREWLLD